MREYHTFIVLENRRQRRLYGLFFKYFLTFDRSMIMLVYLYMLCIRNIGLYLLQFYVYVMPVYINYNVIVRMFIMKFADILVQFFCIAYFIIIFKKKICFSSYDIITKATHHNESVCDTHTEIKLRLHSDWREFNQICLFILC